MSDDVEWEKVEFIKEDMFQLIARNVSASRSTSFSIAESARLVNERFDVMLACFSAKSIINFSSEGSKPLKFINSTFSFEVEVVTRSTALETGFSQSRTQRSIAKEPRSSPSAKCVETEMA